LGAIACASGIGSHHYAMMGLMTPGRGRDAGSSGRSM
jgi:hypothetical protein